MAKRHVAPVAELLIRTDRLPLLTHDRALGARVYEPVLHRQRAESDRFVAGRQHTTEHRERMDVVEGKRGGTLQRPVVAAALYLGTARKRGRLDREGQPSDVR